jgi:hypothetical protein
MAAQRPLLALSGVAHWPTGATFSAVLGLVFVVFLASGWRSLRTGTRLRSLPAVRLLTVLVWSSLLWLVATFALVRSPPDRIEYSVSALGDLFRDRVIRVGLPIGFPVAIFGLVLLSRRMRKRTDDRGPVALFVILAACIGLIAVAVAVWLLGSDVPVHRFVTLSLPVPILGGLVLLGWAELSAVRWRRFVITTGGCAVVAAAGYAVLLRLSPPVLVNERVDSAAAASRYLSEAVPADVPVTVVADVLVKSDWLWQSFFAMLPPERFPQVMFTYEAVSLTHPPGGVVLAARGYTRSFDDIARRFPGRIVAPGLIALDGPLPATPIRAAPMNRVEDVGLLLLLALGVFVILEFAGFGLSVAALGSFLRPFERFAVAPAFGLGALLLGGLVANRAGVLIHDASVYVIVAVIVVGSGGGFLASRRERARLEGARVEVDGGGPPSRPS